MTIYRSWKDRWTAFLWRVCFPGEAIPIDILPSYYAELEAKNGGQLQIESNKMEDVLTQAVCLDMDAHPSAWKRKDPKYTYDSTQYLNKEADIDVVICGIRSSSCKVKGIEVGEKNRQKIVTAFNNRFAAEVIEKLVDRIQNVTTVTPEEVKEEVRPKTVDPFAEFPLETLSQHIEKLKQAAEDGKKMLPPPKKINAPRKATKLQPGPHLSNPRKQLTLPNTSSILERAKNRNSIERMSRAAFSAYLNTLTQRKEGINV